MLHMKVRQKYRNDCGHNIEAVYTFPLAWGPTRHRYLTPGPAD